MRREEPIVYVVDDDPSVREALVFLLASDGLAAEAFESADAFLGYEPTRRPACLLADISMPGIDGLELQQRLNARGAGLPVLFLTGQGTVPRAARAFKAGAVDFLEKPVDDDVLLAAVRTALAARTEQVEDGMVRAEFERRLALLTPRERDVFDRVVDGLRNQDIGEELGIALQTVKIHRGRVMEKMGVDSLAHLVSLAERFDLRRPV